MIRRILEILLCKHKWKKLWLESAWWSGNPGENVLETWYCECEECKHHKFVVFEVHQQGE